MIPLALALLERIDDPQDRRLVGLRGGRLRRSRRARSVRASLHSTGPGYGEGLTRWALVAAIPLIPGLAAAGPIDRRATDGASPAPASRRLLESTEYAVIGATPAVALAVDHGAGRVPPPVAGLVRRDPARRPVHDPAARAAGDARHPPARPRRRRHGGGTGQGRRRHPRRRAPGADAARPSTRCGRRHRGRRHRADRVRSTAGDLRRPAAADPRRPRASGRRSTGSSCASSGWPAARSASSAPTGRGPPADVELAFFRVAQEALANAVKHGQPPILVRYATTAGGASLSIDDAGPGIEPDAGEGADRAGHFGLLNMQQRAEAIGAILDVRRWPAGGTHVALDWRAT